MPSERSRVNLPSGTSLLTKAIRRLSKHNVYGGVRLDSFRHTIIKPDGRFLDHFDLVEARVWLAASNPSLNVSADATAAAIDWIANSQRYDSLTEHVETLDPWDGVPRLDTWLIKHLHADDTELTRWISRKFIISAIARALEPGVKVDHVLVLHGQHQGEGKSRTVGVLGGDFTRELTCSVTDKDAKVQLQGAWFVEFADLGSLPRSEINAVKGFISQTVDNYRPPYGRQTLPHPRRTVFVVTTNDLSFINDASGARRFWPVTCNMRNNEYSFTKAERNQLFAEARTAYYEGEKWYALNGEHELCENLRAAQEQLQQEDTWFDEIAKFVADRESVTTASVLGSCLGISPCDRSVAVTMRVAACLKRLGFKRIRAPYQANGGVRGWVYVR